LGNVDVEAAEDKAGAIVDGLHAQLLGLALQTLALLPVQRKLL
jgi:hypothetical protein